MTARVGNQVSVPGGGCVTELGSGEECRHGAKVDGFRFWEPVAKKIRITSPAFRYRFRIRRAASDSDLVSVNGSWRSFIKSIGACQAHSEQGCQLRNAGESLLRELVY